MNWWKLRGFFLSDRRKKEARNIPFVFWSGSGADHTFFPGFILTSDHSLVKPAFLFSPPSCDVRFMDPAGSFRLQLPRGCPLNSLPDGFSGWFSAEALPHYSPEQKKNEG